MGDEALLSSDLYRASRCETSDLREMVSQLNSPFFADCAERMRRSPDSAATLLRREAKGDPKLESAVEILILGRRKRSLLLKGAKRVERLERLEEERGSATALQRYTLLASSLFLVPFILSSTLQISKSMGSDLQGWSILFYVGVQALLSSLLLERARLSPLISLFAIAVYKLTEVIL